MPRHVNRRHQAPGYVYEVKYCADLIELGKQGKSVAEFCLLAMITERTFHEWCKKYPEFQEAKFKARAYAEAWWAALAQQNIVTYPESPKIDTSLFKFITGGRFGMSGKPKLNLDLAGKSIQEQQNVAIEAMESGEILPEQAADIANVLKASISVEEHEALMSKVEELEKKLAAMTSMKMGNKVADEPEYEVIDDDNKTY